MAQNWFDNVNDGDVLYETNWDSLQALAVFARSIYFSANDPARFTIPFNLSSGSLVLPRGIPLIYDSFTMSGGTITTTGNAGDPLIIFVDGAVSITSGTIDLSGKGKAGGSNGNPGTSGGGTDLSGYGGTAKVTGGGSGTGGANNSGGGGGAGAGANGNAAANGSSGTGGTAGAYVAFASSELPNDLTHYLNSMPGAGGGGGGDGSGTGGDGGAGGGTLILISRGNMTVSGGTITVAATEGGDGSGGGTSGGGGGGGGGSIVFLYGGTYTSGATLTVTAGAGGAAQGGGSAGGDGGAGTSLATAF